MTDFLNIDTARSYATEASLVRALAKLGLDKMQPLIVCNRQGRFTAVFGFHNSGLSLTGDVTFAARHGFKTID